jgi:ketosteroid isomerase-like protein
MKEPSVSNLATVQGIYAAFGRRDVPAILEFLAEDVVWEYGLNSTDVPWLQPRRGRAEVVKFFEALGAIDFARLEASAFFEAGSTVVVLLQLEATVKATGRQVVEEDEVHIWHFDAAGRVSRFRHRVDTLLHQLAYHGT